MEEEISRLFDLLKEQEATKRQDSGKFNNLNFYKR